MTIRFFILQAHYRSTLDFSNDALKASEKAFKRIINGLRSVKSMEHPQGNTSADEALSQRIEAACRQAFEGMNDDLNTAVALAGLFELLKVINSLRGGQIAWETLEISAFEKMKSTYLLFVEEILGLREEPGKSSSPMHTMMETVLEAYRNAKDRKDYALVDAIRANVKKEGIVIRDAKTGISWDYEE
jgi:cysteinyl-tRNA synthetase